MQIFKEEIPVKKVIISAALTGAGTTREAAPTVPITADEIAQQVVEVAKAGAAIVHIHVRDDNGWPTMSTEKFTEAFTAIKKATKAAGVDVVVNLTTSGSNILEKNEIRLAHLKKLRPEICSYDSGTFNWNYGGVFVNAPDFLEELSECVIEEDIKPEFEIFDNGMLGNALYYIQKYNIPAPCHFQFVLGVGGAASGTTKNLVYLRDMLPEGSTWSVTGIGKAHMNMMLAALSMDCDGLRVGLEDNLYMSHGVKATNVQLVERAAELVHIAGREVASAEEARQMLGISRHSLEEYHG